MQPPHQPEPVLPSDREYLMARRQALLMELNAIERRLNLPRSVPSQQQRHQERRAAEVWGRRGCVAEGE